MRERCTAARLYSGVNSARVASCMHVVAAAAVEHDETWMLKTKPQRVTVLDRKGELRACIFLDCRSRYGAREGESGGRGRFVWNGPGRNPTTRGTWSKGRDRPRARNVWLRTWGRGRVRRARKEKKEKTSVVKEKRTLTFLCIPARCSHGPPRCITAAIGTPDVVT